MAHILLKNNKFLSRSSVLFWHHYLEN